MAKYFWLFKRHLLKIWENIVLAVKTYELFYCNVFQAFCRYFVMCNNKCDKKLSTHFFDGSEIFYKGFIHKENPEFGRSRILDKTLKMSEQGRKGSGIFWLSFMNGPFHNSQNFNENLNTFSSIILNLRLTILGCTRRTWTRTCTYCWGSTCRRSLLNTCSSKLFLYFISNYFIGFKSKEFYASLLNFQLCVSPPPIRNIQNIFFRKLLTWQNLL